jgi:3-demethylubiquinone-9 3-methyltransferase
MSSGGSRRLRGMSTQRITTNLWFDTQAEEAAEYYCSIFADARVVSVVPYPDGTGRAGKAMVVEFELLGQRLVAINGGPQFTFDEAISLQIDRPGRRLARRASDVPDEEARHRGAGGRPRRRRRRGLSDAAG